MLYEKGSRRMTKELFLADEAKQMAGDWLANLIGRKVLTNSNLLKHNIKFCGASCDILFGPSSHFAPFTLKAAHSLFPPFPSHFGCCFFKGASMTHIKINNILSLYKFNI